MFRTRYFILRRTTAWKVTQFEEVCFAQEAKSGF